MLAGGNEMRREELTLDCALSCRRELWGESVRYLPLHGRELLIYSLSFTVTVKP